MSKSFQFGANGRAAHEEAEKKPGVRTVLGAGCSVEGRLICSGPTRLDGGVNGELVADDFLLIDKNATVVADLSVQELVVRGRVRGNIKAKRRCALEASAMVEGDIETPAITITDGAQVVGKIEVTRREPVEIDAGDVETDAIVRKFAPMRKEDAAKVV
jgi:cytoskeletal protein CcmA (bactofilin family)